MVDILAGVFEDSIVAGGFLFLLHHVLRKQDELLSTILKKQDKLLSTFAEELKASTLTQQEISKTLLIFNDRLMRLEENKGDE